MTELVIAALVVALVVGGALTIWVLVQHREEIDQLHDAVHDHRQEIEYLRGDHQDGGHHA